MSAVRSTALELSQLMMKLLPTLMLPPENAGTRALLYLPATQPPTGVPAKGGESTTAETTEPSPPKVTLT